MNFVDTNYFLRLLLKDNSEQHEIVKRLFLSAAEGKVALFTSTIVIFEIYWVLSAYYEKEKSEIISVLQNILKLTFIRLEESEILQNSILLFQKSNLDLEDCYNLCYAKFHQVVSFNTFDKKLDKEFIKR
jgi:predicted nucleic acid-binding protein